MKKINMYGLNESTLRGLENYKITLITKKYERTSSGKSWKKNPVETDEEVISPKKFELIISSIPFFKNLGGSERVTKGYTVAGYIPVELSSISPERKTKIVRSFKVER